MGLWLWLLVGCFAPTETSDAGMVGHLRTADGTPLVGVPVETLEARTWTAEDGGFVVEWKKPSYHIDFRLDQVHWRRTRQPDDKGDVEVRLPPLRELPIRCESTSGCDVVLEWRETNALSARARVPCKGEITLKGTPNGPLEEVSCRKKGKPAAMTVLEGGAIVVRDRP